MEIMDSNFPNRLHLWRAHLPVDNDEAINACASFIFGRNQGAIS